MYSDILLTVDFDRTLTDFESRIPQRNIEAIEYFIAHGGKFTVNTGRSTAAHLHFEIWKGSEPVDPLDLLPAPEILRSARR